MKKRSIVPLMAASLLLIAAVHSARAYSAGAIAVTIPFSFTIGTNVLPAGSYSVAVRQNVLQIRNAETYRNLFGLCVTDTLGTAKLGLLFHRYGDQYFLVKISMGEAGESTLIKSKKEQELEAGKSNRVVQKPKSEPLFIAAQ